MAAVLGVLKAGTVIRPTGVVHSRRAELSHKLLKVNPISLIVCTCLVSFFSTRQPCGGGPSDRRCLKDKPQSCLCAPNKRPGIAARAEATRRGAGELRPDSRSSPIMRGPSFKNRGNALQELKRLDEALASYDKALALKPETAHRADSDRECRTMSLFFRFIP